SRRFLPRPHVSFASQVKHLGVIFHGLYGAESQAVLDPLRSESAFAQARGSPVAGEKEVVANTVVQFHVHVQAGDAEFHLIRLRSLHPGHPGSHGRFAMGGQLEMDLDVHALEEQDGWIMADEGKSHVPVDVGYAERAPMPEYEGMPDPGFKGKGGGYRQTVVFAAFEVHGLGKVDIHAAQADLNSAFPCHGILDLAPDFECLVPGDLDADL